MAFDYAEFSAGDVSVDQILEAANTFPMLSKKRLVLISEADKLKDADQDALLDALNRLSPRCVLVFFAEEFDHRKKFYRVMREKYCVAEFPKLKGMRWKNGRPPLSSDRDFDARHPPLKKLWNWQDPICTC